MPVIDDLAAEYGDRVDFVAPAWKASSSATAERAAELLPSGKVMWGLDADQVVFAAYQVPYQPVTVLITHDRVIFDSWLGARAEEEMRQAIETLLDLAGG